MTRLVKKKKETLRALRMGVSAVRVSYITTDNHLESKLARHL